MSHSGRRVILVSPIPDDSHGSRRNTITPCLSKRLPLRACGRRQPQGPHVIGVLLTFDQKHRLMLRDGGQDFGQMVENTTNTVKAR